jgi:hypothetical protein
MNSRPVLFPSALKEIPASWILLVGPRRPVLSAEHQPPTGRGPPFLFATPLGIAALAP